MYGRVRGRAPVGLSTETREADAATPVEAMIGEGNGEDMFTGMSVDEAFHASGKLWHLSFCCCV